MHYQGLLCHEDGLDTTGRGVEGGRGLEGSRCVAFAAGVAVSSRPVLLDTNGQHPVGAEGNFRRREKGVSTDIKLRV